jgi:histone H3/H4
MSITGIKLAQYIIAIEALMRRTCVKLLTVVSRDSAEDSSRSSVQQSSKRVIKRTMDGQSKANARMNGRRTVEVIDIVGAGGGT